MKNQIKRCREPRCRHTIYKRTQKQAAVTLSISISLYLCGIFFCTCILLAVSAVLSVKSFYFSYVFLPVVCNCVQGSDDRCKSWRQILMSCKRQRKNIIISTTSTCSGTS